MSVPGGRAVVLDPERSGSGAVICDRCGYYVDLLACQWRCWHCDARWPFAEPIGGVVVTRRGRQAA